MTRAPLPDRLLLDAAIAGVFDPRELLDPDHARYAQDLAGLAELSIETAFGPLWLWSLTEDARRAGLALLPPPGPARAAQLAATRPRDGDEIGRAILDLLAPAPGPDLRRLLAGQATTQSDERLIALFKMLELIGSAGTVLPDWLTEGDTRRKLQRAIMRRRAEKASDAVLPTRFRGRRRELTCLRDFALTGDLPKPGSGAIRRLTAANPQGVPTLLVSGIGGTGKSALIEQLRRRLKGADRVVLAHFDLDRAALRMGDQVALAQELLRQIGYALPALDAGVAVLRGQIRNAMALSLGSIDIEAAASAIFGAMSGLRELLAGAGMDDHALVIVIDTFEEALILGPQRVAQIAEWLHTLRDHGGFAALRVILSGRSAEVLTDMPQDLATLGVIALDELGTHAGRAKLRDMFRLRDIAHEDLIPDLIAEFGSNPLVIEILAIYCRERPRDEITGLMHGSDPHARSGFGAEMRQRFLYSRILDRLTDPELKPLANPGLVLRRIEPAQIAGLLAEPCGLSLPMPPERARALFDRLAAHVWLVRPAGPDAGMLEHLPDLRRLMLPQILDEPAAREVARAAARWFTSGPGASQPGAMFDATYYAILAGDADLPEDADQLHDLALHLGAAADDLPAAAQARLREAQGHVLRVDEITHLQGPARDRAIKKRRETQRTHGLETSVVQEQADFGQTITDAIADKWIGVTIKPALSPVAARQPGAQVGDSGDFTRHEGSASTRPDFVAGAHDFTPYVNPAPLDPPVGVKDPQHEALQIGRPGASVVVRAAPLRPISVDADTASDSGADSTALIQSLFAAGQFDQLANAALPETQKLFDKLLTGDLTATADEPMQHPAYLAALAMLAQDGQLQAFRADLADWLRASGLRRRLHKPAAPASMHGPGGNPLEIALMVLTVTGHLDTGDGIDLARTLHDMLPDTFVARSLAQWRAFMARARMTGRMASVALPVMPVFAPVLVRRMGWGKDTGTDLAIGDSQRDQMRDLQQSRAPASLRDLAGIEQALSGAVLHLMPEAARRDDLHPLIPGRQPEFHAPLRVLLTQGTVSGSLAWAIAPFADIPWWPTELRPETFNGRQNTTQILALIDMLDKFGGLTAFVAVLTRASDAPPELTQLHRIMTRAGAAWVKALSLT